MKTISLALFAGVLVLPLGCATKPVTYSAPVTAQPVIEQIKSAQISARVTAEKARDALIGGLKAQSPEAAAMLAAAKATERELALTQERAQVLEQDLVLKNRQHQRDRDRLAYLEPKYQEAVALIWKWRLYFIFLSGAVAVFFILRQYFPFLKAL